MTVSADPGWTPPAQPVARRQAFATVVSGSGRSLTSSTYSCWRSSWPCWQSWRESGSMTHGAGRHRERILQPLILHLIQPGLGACCPRLLRRTVVGSWSDGRDDPVQPPDPEGGRRAADWARASDWPLLRASSLVLRLCHRRDLGRGRWPQAGVARQAGWHRGRSPKRVDSDPWQRRSRSTEWVARASE